MSVRDEWELEWWRHFATKIAPDCDMPRVGSALLGNRYIVKLVPVDPPSGYLDEDGQIVEEW